jgi:DNA helicase-2/ATP-dependent DNA helicase PcrA
METKKYLTARDLAKNISCEKYQKVGELKVTADIQQKTTALTTTDFAAIAKMYWMSDKQYMAQNELEDDEVIHSYTEVNDIVVNSVSGTTDEMCKPAEDARVKELAKGCIRYVRDEKRVNDGIHTVEIDKKIPVTANDAPEFAETFPKLKELPFLASFNVLLTSEELDPATGENIPVLEGITFKGGRPYYSTIKGKRPPEFDPEFNLKLKALQTLVPEGKSAKLVVSIYYMRNRQDKEGEDWTQNNFFGNNIVSLTEVYKNDADFKKKMPVNEEAVKNFEAINAVHECDPEDCERCMANAFCNFVPTPEAIEQKTAREYREVKYSDEQQKVVHHRVGEMLCIAGPGSGKTACVVGNVKYNVKVDVDSAMNGVSIPTDARINDEVLKSLGKYLLITFTDAGAKEMKERLVLALKADGYDVTENDVRIMTFNSFAYSICRKFYDELGFSKQPELVDEIILSSIIVNCLNENRISGLDYEHFDMSTKDCVGALAVVKEAINVIKTQQIDVSDPNAAAELRNNMKYGRFIASSMAYSELCSMYADIQKMFLSEGKMTYADQEPMALKMINAHPDYIDDLGIERIIVDEFQDTNPIQIDILNKLLAARNYTSLLCVGDDFQAIYGFRNASSEFILNLDKYVGRTVEKVYLTENHRSTPQILDVSNEFIATNQNQLKKQMSAVNEAGKPVVVRTFFDRNEEFKYVVESAIKLYEEGTPLRDICCLVKKNSDADTLAAMFAEKGVPVVMKNPQKFLENSRVQAALSLMRAVNNPSATELYLGYVQALFNGNALESRTVTELSGIINQMAISFAGFADADEHFQRKEFHKLLDAINLNDELYDSFLKKVYAQEDFPSELQYMSDFMRYGKAEEERLKADYEGLTITTCHSSKGLEWPVVFLSISGIDNEMLKDPDEIEESRRVIYVAMTRAKKRLFVTGVGYVGRKRRNDISTDRFLKELCDIVGNEFVIIDTGKEAREEERRQKNAEKQARKELYSIRSGTASILAGLEKVSDAKLSAGGRGKSKTLTAAEKLEYNRLAASGKQMSLKDIFAAS